MNRIHLLLASAVLSLILAPAHGGDLLSTEFTYQGVLKQAGIPAVGTFHMRFQLWDALIGGTQIGGDLDDPAVVVEGGVFTSALDFGTAPFSGSARWLQVQVITNGGNSVVALAPQQPMTAAPYALFARSADGATLTNLNASNINSGSLSPARLPNGGAWPGQARQRQSGRIFRRDQ